MDQLAARKIDRIVITKRGRPVALLSPSPARKEAVDAFFGFMKGSVGAPEGFDFTEPVLAEPLAAERGILQRRRSRNSRPALTIGRPS